MPETLAVPLPIGARVTVPIKTRVRCGETLATGDLIADVIAPADGVIGKTIHLPLATSPPQSATCLILNNARQAPPIPIDTSISILALLKKSGIVGLGGGGFPAWRKWRPQLRWCIINALESHPLLHCDKALMAYASDAVLQATYAIGNAFADRTILAVNDKYATSMPKSAIVRPLTADYAAGNERLLIRQLTGIRVPAQWSPTDWGIVCFNVATVLAMHEALKNGVPLYERVITLWHNHRTINLRVPFGATLTDLANHIGITPVTVTANDATVTPNTVVTPATALVCFNENTAAEPALSCIRCGACDSVCPESLSPLNLLAFAQDEKWEEMENTRLNDCLECRRCDAVCPSRIPLSDIFAANKRQLIKHQQATTRRTTWQAKHDRHQQRERRTITAKKTLLKSTVAAIIGKPLP